jgi:RNase adaptor protein for sRNA GlmZ degradation
MALVIVGGASVAHVRAALQAFETAGWERAAELDSAQEHDAVLVGDASLLREADRRGIRYCLVHCGPDDGLTDGTFARAHHRVETSEVAGLARRLRSRERLLVRCRAFGFREGIPADCDWVVDARFLDNPYWVEELRPLDGRHPLVRNHVLAQEAAGAVLDHLERALRAALPGYQRQGRGELVIGFGCTGGRHRSVALAAELARRLEAAGGVEVRFEPGDLGP